MLDVDGGLDALDLKSGTVDRQGVHAEGATYTPRNQPVATSADGGVLLDGHLVARVPPEAVGGPIAVAGSTVVTSGAHMIAAVSLRSGGVVWSQTFGVRFPEDCAFIAASVAAGSSSAATDSAGSSVATS